jgi:hypothetical protein
VAPWTSTGIAATPSARSAVSTSIRTRSVTIIEAALAGGTLDDAPARSDHDDQRVAGADRLLNVDQVVDPGLKFDIHEDLVAPEVVFEPVEKAPSMAAVSSRL